MQSIQSSCANVVNIVTVNINLCLIRVLLMGYFVVKGKILNESQRSVTVVLFDSLERLNHLDTPISSYD